MPGTAVRISMSVMIWPAAFSGTRPREELGVGGEAGVDEDAAHRHGRPRARGEVLHHEALHAFGALDGAHGGVPAEGDLGIGARALLERGGGAQAARAGESR